ncbi:Uncharacterized conserved protein YtfP, gamma-glutamylcyclotransferase (GGCT)/AIG2-like family [Oceanospirillum multiglobuliferum]|uniref:Gamma-glutamylcyclotransferase AIG2-like domain-containing protein n=1 Tax=Oceanospirillum multiglobuliferum TaxID=64969 RepID=A0A1T4SB58_9GAMM|nr:gamma-glutamylcyclotransferase family protein [Oceanospirillum multiglobuliferum]OPX55020.1 hypothetical protein BTE48_11010 [Oceanospirillum multiglobuliferum]SKA25442.1 Uncharacterized conserved protein YtfP, gamma-glutamylcyclotransferase (GGCT)/AIG2-like family [Oceanospirillum multiglobuliferum]
MSHYVAVYGSLRAGLINHYLLGGSTLIGTILHQGLTLYDLGEYPAALRHPSTGVILEVYRIENATLALLDRLEDYEPLRPNDSLYLRETLKTPFGLCWVYLYNQSLAGVPIVASGDWLDYYSAKQASSGGCCPYSKKQVEESLVRNK